MTDLVARLRWPPIHGSKDHPVSVALRIEAADEIERLRAAERESFQSARKALERTKTLLSQIAGKNDLSGIEDDALFSAACHALVQCESLAREALEIVGAALSGKPQPQCAPEPVAWAVTWPDGAKSYYQDKPIGLMPGNSYEPLFGAAAAPPQCAREADNEAMMHLLDVVPGDTLMERVIKLKRRHLELQLHCAVLSGKPGAEPQRPADALRLLADLFSESVHETWTKGEIVSVIEDAIALGARPDSNTPPAPVWQKCPSCGFVCALTPPDGGGGG